MDHLWAPWRKAYVIDGARAPGCVFCTKGTEDRDAENYVLHRAEYCFVLMNIYPYNNGHIMVVPYRHISDYDDLEDHEAMEMTALTRRFIRVLKKTLAPHGFNTGMNLGDVAGAGIAAHVHMHIVPRWSGDSNFMPVIGETKVISEGLAHTYAKLIQADASPNPEQEPPE